MNNELKSSPNFEGLVVGGGGGRPDYLQRLKVPEGYEKINDYRSQLYRSRILQVNTRLKALDEFYKIYTYASLGEKNRN